MSEPTLAEQIEACTDRCRAMDAPLSDRLSAMADDVRRLSPAFAKIVDRMVERLQQGGAGIGAPEIGDFMPSFVLPDDNGRLVSLEQLLARGKVVIAFHRGHWCPYCIINAEALAKINEVVRDAGAQLVAITPETQQFTRQLKADTGADFPILTDLDNGYALELNLAIKVDEQKRKGMVAAGWDISGYNDNQEWILPIPATFVIDEDGRVVGRFVDPDYRKRMDIDELVKALGRKQG